MLGTVIAFAGAAFYFYKQRSVLVALHGSITLPVARCAAQDSQERRDSPSLSEGLLFADSYELWNPYQWGLASLYLAAVQAILSLIAAKFKFPFNTWTWITQGVLFAVAGISAFLVCQSRLKLDASSDSKPVSRRRKKSKV